MYVENALRKLYKTLTIMKGELFVKRKHHIICAIFISLLLIFFSTFLVITLVLNSGNVSSSLLFGIILSAILLVLCSIVVFWVTEVNINKYENLYENEKNKAFEAQFDKLTLIYTKDKFKEEVCKRVEGKMPKNSFYLIRFDMYHFAIYNDLFGSVAGDELLKYIAQVLISLEEKYNLVYGRLYKDVFMVFVDATYDGLNILCNEINENVKRFNPNFNINLVFGACEVKASEEFNIGKSIENAKLAAFPLKGHIGKNLGIYKPEMKETRLKEQSILNEMNQALDNGEFVIYFQPKFDIFTGKIVGAESLVRWLKNGKVISPGEFIPIFEKNGFIAKLDLFVWEETVKYLKLRQDENKPMFPISVNVSRTILGNSDFIDSVVNLVKKYNIPPKYLELEITETIFSDVDLVKSTVNKLREHGFKVLMDDFGSGYSSLNVLKDIEFDVVKIDLKFFSKYDEKSLKIIDSVIKLCNKLNIPAIAEGVETKIYVDLLKEFGCKYAQGFFYSKPISVNDFNLLIEKNELVSLSA